MSKFFYDLHIHSDLSPCGNSEMTPNNIVNMAYIKGLDIIAITDHNSMKNYLPVQKVAKKRNIEVIPGIEVTSKEEVHLLCYFKDYLSAEKFDKIIYDSLPNIRNRAKTFGEQNIYNDKDEIIGKMDKLLLNSTKYSIADICNITKKFNGIVIPAHVDRHSFGIIGVLGFIPDNLNFKYIEISSDKKVDTKILDKYYTIKNSDAHRLAKISEPVNYFKNYNYKDFHNEFFRDII